MPFVYVCLMCPFMGNPDDKRKGRRKEASKVTVSNSHAIYGTLILLPWSGLWVAFSQALSHLFSGSLHEVHLSPFPSYGSVLISFELAVIIGEFIVENGDWHPVEDNPKSNAQEGKKPAQVGLWVHVSVAHSGDAHLYGKEGRVEVLAP